jgi:NAD(P)-dependent dehydrogenase (short-subunit alcohol dehydrogenase family)
MKDFRDKVVVITGAGSGIGRATALAFAERGARLYLVDLRADRLEEVSAAVRLKSCSASIHALDCTDSAAMTELAASIFAHEGRVDVLQNGVGILVAAPVESLSLADWRKAIELNIWSVVLGLHAFLPRMLSQGGESQVVIIASVAGLVGFPFTAPYSMTKFALVGLAEALTLELSGRGVEMLVVCPGMIRSNLIADGLLHLPGKWVKVVDQAYQHLAPTAEGLARQILRAVRQKKKIIVPSLALSQLWRLKSWSGASYYQTTSNIMRGLRRLGTIPVLPSANEPASPEKSSP